MKLTLYLFKAHVQDFGQCVKPQTAKRNYKDITNKQRDDVDDMRIYAIDKEPSIPKWTSFLAGFADGEELGRLQNRAASALVLWRTQTADGPRIFAASHGMAYSLIDDSLIERNFGLRTTLNSIVPHKIKSLDYKNISARGTQRKEAAGSATNLAQFGFEDDSEVLKAVTGRAVDDELGYVLSGADSLKVGIKDLQFSQLNEVAQKAYDRFTRTIYKENFDFIDHFEYERNPLTIAELDHELVLAMGQASPSPHLGVVYPDQMQYNECDHFKLKVHNAEDTFDEIEIRSLHKFLRDNVGTLDIDTLKTGAKIMGLDDTGESRTPLKNVYSFLAFELTHNGAKYVLSDAKWYKIDDEFVQRLDEWLSQNVQQAEVSLRSFGLDSSENEYCAGFASDENFTILRSEFFRPKGHGKIKVADVYHKPTNRLIFIKKLSAASSISHLLGQATISADLLRENDQRAWEFLLTHIQQQWPDLHKEQLEQNLGFVIAIACERQMPEALPIFSKIALKKACRAITKLGLKFQIQQIN